MKKVAHVIISLIYIAWGIGAPLTAIQAIVNLDPGALLSAAVGVVMLLAGIFGLLRIKPLKRRIFGVIIFLLAAVSVVTSLWGGHVAWQAILQAVLAWLYIIW